MLSRSSPTRLASHPDDFPLRPASPSVRRVAVASRQSTPLERDTSRSPAPALAPEREPARQHAPLSPAALVHRASRYPASITPGQVQHLHGALGNRNVGRLLERAADDWAAAPATHPATATEPELIVGQAGDRAEQE